MFSLHATAKILFVLIAIALSNSCGTTYNTYSESQNMYSVSLASVESPVNAKVRWGETKIVETYHNGIPQYQYEDDYIRIAWHVSSTQFNFHLMNKTSYTIKINWDEMVYVDETGTARRVMHAGVKYTDRNLSQPHSVIPKNTSITDIVLPTNKVQLDYTATILFGTPATWEEQTLFPTYSSYEEVKSSGILGKHVRIVFPIIIQDVLNEYVFKFQIDSIQLNRQ